MQGQPSEFEPVPMDSEDDLFIVYTLGTTNNPRRIVHSQAGYLLYTAFTHKVWCYSTISGEVRSYMHTYGNHHMIVDTLDVCFKAVT